MLLSTKSMCHKSNFRISWMYLYQFHDLKVYFLCLTNGLKFDKACLNTLYVSRQGMRYECGSPGKGASWRAQVSKSAGAHSTRSLKISGCKRWCPKDLRVRAPAAPLLTHSLCPFGFLVLTMHCCHSSYVSVIIYQIGLSFYLSYITDIAMERNC